MGCSEEAYLLMQVWRWDDSGAQGASKSLGQRIVLRSMGEPELRL